MGELVDQPREPPLFTAGGTGFSSVINFLNLEVELSFNFQARERIFFWTCLSN